MSLFPARDGWVHPSDSLNRHSRGFSNSLLGNARCRSFSPEFLLPKTNFPFPDDECDKRHKEICYISITPHTRGIPLCMSFGLWRCHCHDHSLLSEQGQTKTDGPECGSRPRQAESLQLQCLWVIRPPIRLIKHSW